VAHVISVNLAVPRHSPATDPGITGIDKRPAPGPVQVTAPGPRGSGRTGLTGDRVFDTPHHGGDDKAVYAYAREDLDAWQAELGRPLDGGVFGENLTTSGLDVTGALIGERWRVGADVVLEVAIPRIPCRTFAHWMDERGWIKRFTEWARPGAYLRVVAPGAISAGDPVDVVRRPAHDVTIGVVFRALTLEPDLLPRLLTADALPDEVHEKVRRRASPAA
jgi:MOSC domain-containing protein YiiM